MDRQMDTADQMDKVTDEQMVGQVDRQTDAFPGTHPFRNQKRLGCTDTNEVLNIIHKV